MRYQRWRETLLPATASPMPLGSPQMFICCCSFFFYLLFCFLENISHFPFLISLILWGPVKHRCPEKCNEQCSFIFFLQMCVSHSYFAGHREDYVAWICPWLLPWRISALGMSVGQRRAVDLCSKFFLSCVWVPFLRTAPTAGSTQSPQAWRLALEHLHNHGLFPPTVLSLRPLMHFLTHFKRSYAG